MATIRAGMLYDNTTLANYMQWAKTIGTSIAALGWVKDTNDPSGYQVVWANAAAIPTGDPYCNNNAQGPQAAGPWVSGTSYVGTNINNGGAFSMVTDGGVTYACISATNGTTNPGADPTHWQPYNYEIWKSNGPLSASIPIYLKLVYTCSGGIPVLIYSLGTSSLGNGFLGGNTFNNGFEVFTAANGSAAGATQYNSEFSGDADNLRMILWHGAASVNGNIPLFMIIDRAADTSSTRMDAFFTFAAGHSGNTGFIQFFMKEGTQFPTGLALSYNSNSWPNVKPPLTSSTFQGLIPVFPIFPSIGYLANPMLGLLGFAYLDVQDGSLINTFILGASHTYLIGKFNIGGAVFGGPTNACIGILWE